MFKPKLTECPPRCYQCGSHHVLKADRSPWEACSHTWECRICGAVLGAAEYKPEVKPELTEDQKLALKILQDNRQLGVVLDVATAYCIVAALQLATRHPSMSDWMKDEIKQAATGIQAGIDLYQDGAFDLLDKGWNPDNDIDMETDDND